MRFLVGRNVTYFFPKCWKWPYLAKRRVCFNVYKMLKNYKMHSIEEWWVAAQWSLFYGLRLTGFSPFSCPSSRSNFARVCFFVIYGLESEDDRLRGLRTMFASYNKAAPDSKTPRCLISSCMLPSPGLKFCRQNLQGGECPKNPMSCGRSSLW